MALFGEYDDTKEFMENWETIERNKTTWNAWIGQSLNDDQKVEISKGTIITPRELSLWKTFSTWAELQFQTVWKERNPGKPGPRFCTK